MERFSLHHKAVYSLKGGLQWDLQPKPEYYTQELEEDENGQWVKYEDAAARISELEAQLAAAQERERWIPCSELPSDKRRVLIKLYDGLMLVGRYDKEGGYDENGAWQDDEYWILDNPTHWRELPAPPEVPCH